MAKGQLGGERDQTVGGLRKTRHKGVARVGSAYRRQTRSKGAFNSTKLLCLAIHSPAFASVLKLLIVVG